MDDQLLVEFGAISPLTAAIAPQVIVDQGRFSRANGPQYADQRMLQIAAPEKFVEIQLVPVGCIGRTEIDLVDPLSLGKVEVGEDVLVPEAARELRPVGKDVGSVARVEEAVGRRRAVERVCLGGGF